MAPTQKKPNKKSEIIRIEGEIVEAREAPVERAIAKAQIVNPQLSDKQLDILLNRTPDWAIKKRQGPGGRTYSYVPHGYITDTLNKAFGFDWDLIIDPTANGNSYALQIEEVSLFEKGKKTGEFEIVRHVAVAGHIEIRLRHPKNLEIIGTIKKYGFGSQRWLPTMEFGDALKAATSDLLKVCASKLGVALDLYYNEQAEIAQWEEKQNKVREEAEIMKMAVTKVSTDPTTGVLLLSRCMKDFGWDGSKLSLFLGVELSVLLVADEEKIASWWQLVKAENGTEPK